MRNIRKDAWVPFVFFALTGGMNWFLFRGQLLPATLAVMAMGALVGGYIMWLRRKNSGGTGVFVAMFAAIGRFLYRQRALLIAMAGSGLIATSGSTFNPLGASGLGALLLMVGCYYCGVLDEQNKRIHPLSALTNEQLRKLALGAIANIQTGKTRTFHFPPTITLADITFTLTESRYAEGMTESVFNEHLKWLTEHQETLFGHYPDLDVVHFAWNADDRYMTDRLAESLEAAIAWQGGKGSGFLGGVTYRKAHS